MDRGQEENLALAGTIRIAPSDELFFALSYDYGEQEPKDDSRRSHGSAGKCFRLSAAPCSRHSSNRIKQPLLSFIAGVSKHHQIPARVEARGINTRLASLSD